MYPLKVFLTVVIFSISCSLQAQSLLKAIPAPHQVRTFRSIAPAATAADSTFTGFRFVGPTVLYTLPNSTLFTGAGIAYEHDTYRSAAGKWYTDWSVNLEGYAGGQFAPKDVSGVTAVGLSVSFFNKVLTVGILYNLTTDKVAAGIGPTVSLNN